MEDKNIALLGFVSSAADYLKKQIKDNSEEIKELDEIDLDKIKSELGNRLGSSFGGVQDKSNDLINAGREAFNDFINDSSKMIDEFNDIFNVDFKKENDEKDEEMVNHLISILREPSKFEETNDFETQIARAANESYIDDNKKIEVPGSDNEELDSLFSEIIANENIKVEEPVLNPFVDIETEFESETKTEEEPVVEKTLDLDDDLDQENVDEDDEIEKDNSLKAEEIKQLIRDTISEFFTNTNKPEEKEVKLDEVINSFDVLKNVGVDEENDEINENEEDNKDEEFAEFESLCSGLDEVEYEELNPNNDSLLDGVFKRVDEYEEINEEELAELEEEPDVDLEDLLRPIDVLIEEEPVDDTLSPTNMLKDKEVVCENVIDNDDSTEEEPVVEEPKFSEDMLGVLDALSMDEGILEATKDENIDEEFSYDGDEISLFDDVPLSEKLSNYADHIDEEKEDDYLFDDVNVDEQGSISSFLSELKDDDQISLQEDDVPGMRSLSELIESCNTLCPSEDKEDAPEIVENDYLEEYNNRSLEELYIPNPGLDILEQGEFDLGIDKSDEDSDEDEADFDLGSNKETDYVGDLFDEFTNNEYEVDDFKNKQERINELNKKIYDSIVALYPYLSNGFIKGVYELKESFASDYKEGQKIIILHRLVFADLEGLRQFVDVMMSHEYFVNVDEKQMIVDTFKEHVNSDGKILTDIFEIANQAKLLTGEYDGYRIIEVDE